MTETKKKPSQVSRQVAEWGSWPGFSLRTRGWVPTSASCHWQGGLPTRRCTVQAGQSNLVGPRDGRFLGVSRRAGFEPLLSTIKPSHPCTRPTRSAMSHLSFPPPLKFFSWVFPELGPLRCIYIILFVFLTKGNYNVSILFSRRLWDCCVQIPLESNGILSINL